MDNQSNKTSKKDSVFVSARAPVGKVNIACDDLCIERGLMSISGDNNKFIFYLFKAYKSHIISKETGTIYGLVTKASILNFKFLFPSLHEQDQIVKILSDLDSKIELNHKINKTLEQIAQTIFKS